MVSQDIISNNFTWERNKNHDNMPEIATKPFILKELSDHQIRLEFNFPINSSCFRAFQNNLRNQ